jgi:C-terminal processing protease CtpA/Prc
MTLQETVKNIIFYYVKVHYNDYLKNNNLKHIEDDKINEIISNLYNDKKTDLQKFIRQCLKEMMHDDYPKLIVENIILQIFDDQELAINRVTLEIKKYQEYIINNTGESYNIKLPVDKDLGIGLRIDFSEDEVIVKNFKRDSNLVLPAESSNQISIGDSIIEINSVSLENNTLQEKINIVQQELKNDFVDLKFRTYIKKESNTNELSC